jgi:transcriptional regulator with XRE-family HTH domain
MAELNVPKVVRRVREKLQVSQEGLSRLLNATKGAVQHWERGRNRPDLARLLALRQLCPPSAERKDLDALIRQTQEQVSPLSNGKAILRGVIDGKRRGAHLPPGLSRDGLDVLRRQNQRLEREVARLQSAVERKTEQVRILEDLAKDLQREMANLKATKPAE